MTDFPMTPQPWWQPWIPLLAVLLGTLLGFLLSQWVELSRRRTRRRGNWAALRAEIDFALQTARAYRETHIGAPLYRLPIEAYTEGFKALLGDGAVTETEAQRLMVYYAEVQALNRGLDLVHAARDDTLKFQVEWERNLLKVQAIERYYTQTRAVVDAHL